MKAPLCLAAVAILSLVSATTLAQDTTKPADTTTPAETAKPADTTKPPATNAKVAPRVYTEDDCQELNGQLDDSIAASNLDTALTEKIRRQRTGADNACNSGDFAAGARQLRRILDEVIDARMKAGG